MSNVLSNWIIHSTRHTQPPPWFIQSVMLYIYMTFFNSSCSLTTLDYVIDFCIQQHNQKVIALYSKALGVQKVRWKDILFKRILSQDTQIIWVYYVQHQTDKCRLHKLFHYIFYPDIFYILTLRHVTVPVKSSNKSINFSVTYFSFFAIIITKYFTVTLYPLFLRRGLSPFTPFVNQYPTWQWLIWTAKTCSSSE